MPMPPATPPSTPPAPASKMGFDKKRPQTNASFKMRNSIQPIKTFDRSDMKVLDLPAQAHHTRTSVVPRSVPPHLLMTSILEMVCQSYVRDPAKADKLFKAICNQLTRLHVISPLSFMDEMKSLRQQHRMLVHNIMKKAMRDISHEDGVLALPSAPNIRIERLSSTSDDVISSQTSRYRIEFQELGRLGKGGYGSVYKAQNHLDGRVYAVKKIRFRQKNSLDSLLKLLREVKTLAKLCHMNIVGYNAAWMEYDGQNSPAEPASGGVSLSEVDEEDEDSIFSENSSKPRVKTKKKKKKKKSGSPSDSDSIQFAFSDDDKAAKDEKPAKPITQFSLALGARQFATTRLVEIGSTDAGRKIGGGVNNFPRIFGDVSHSNSGIRDDDGMSETDSVIFADSRNSRIREIEDHDVSETDSVIFADSVSASAGVSDGFSLAGVSDGYSLAAGVYKLNTFSSTSASASDADLVTRVDSFSRVDRASKVNSEHYFRSFGVGVASADNRGVKMDSKGVKIDGKNRSPVVDSAHILTADSHNLNGSRPSDLQLIPVSDSNRMVYRRNISFSGVKSSSVYTDNFGDKVEADEEDSTELRQHSWQRSISFDAAARSSRRNLLTVDDHRNDEVDAVIDTDYQFKNTITLYIQMELCTMTLQDWMTERNASISTVEDLLATCPTIMDMFHQILQGVEYVHSQAMIHRDLKPRNIFIQEDTGHVKIGDFGLAKDYILSSAADTLISPSPVSEEGFHFDSDDHTIGVGTRTYAAPEQMKGTVYDSKCDMYSLGIILFEMCQLFKTDMERVKTIEQLRRGKMPPQFLHLWPRQAKAVKELTQDIPSLRPTTQDLLCSELFLTPQQMIKSLQDVVTAKDSELDELRKLLQEKDKQLQEKDRQLRIKDTELSELRDLVDSSFQLAASVTR